jgi:hypothetical protein
MEPPHLVKPVIPITARVLITVFLLTGLAAPNHATAEWYAAGAVGPNFADRLTNISGTGILSGFQSPDWDLKNSLSFGAKVGYFPQHGWLGLRARYFIRHRISRIWEKFLGSIYESSRQA